MNSTLFMAIVTNGIAITLMAVLLLSTTKARRVHLVDDRLFGVLVILTMLQSFLEVTGFMFDSKPGELNYYLNCIFNTLLFMNNVAFPFIWAIYADYKMHGSRERIKKIYPFVAIPMVVAWIFFIVNLFTPVFYAIPRETNVYERMPLFFMIFVVAYVYLAYGVIMIYISGRNNRTKAMPAILFMIPILLGGSMQFFFYGLSLIPMGVAIALVALYITLQGQVSYVDNLSGLYTRTYLQIYLDSYLRKRNPDRELAGIILDINKFKSINDEHGHLVGDEAIKTVGDVLLKVIPKTAIAVRYGGDEFLILMWIRDKAEIERVIESVNAELDAINAEGERNYELSCSCGYDVYDRDRDFFNNFFSRIDAIMYQNKIKDRAKSSDN